MENKKEMVVSAIENGTVIDHIPTESVYQVIRILGLEKYKDEVLIGNFLSSGKLGKKGIVKIKNKHFSVEEVSKIALVAPFATIIDIEDYKVVKKFNAEVPDHIENFVRCANPKCITNAEAVRSGPHQVRRRRQGEPQAALPLLREVHHQGNHEVQ